MMRNSLIILAIAVILTGCQLLNKGIPEHQQPKLEDYNVGEKWVWQFNGVTSKGEVRAKGFDAREVILENDALFIKTDKHSFPVADLVKPETSETPRFKWPLSVGKKWIFETSWTSQDGTTGKTSFNAEVISYQKENVKAGQFWAYTIRYTGKITNSRGYEADTDETFVYAPKVKNFIKLIQNQEGYTYVEELVEYKD